MRNEHDARALAAAEFVVFIYCDHPSHAGRNSRVACSNFARMRGTALFPDPWWHEVPASRRAVGGGRVGTGYNLVNDGPEVPGWGDDPAIPNSAARVQFELTPARCKAHPFYVNREKLEPVLDFFAASGESAVGLSRLAAIMEEQAKRTLS